MKIDEAQKYAAKCMRAVNYYEMDYSDFDGLVNSYFDLKYFDFVQSGNRLNNSSYIFDVRACHAHWYNLTNEWWYEYNAASIALSHLCGDGIIPEGTYLIKVYW